MPQTAAPATTEPKPSTDLSARENDSSQDIATDGDIRYNAAIVGYSRDIRKRVREAEYQVNLLVTSRVRDHRTAANELVPSTLRDTLERIHVTARLINAGYAGMGDIRAEYVSLAATAIICAEACDRPHELGGLRLLRSNRAEQLRLG